MSATDGGLRVFGSGVANTRPGWGTTYSYTLFKLMWQYVHYQVKIICKKLIKQKSEFRQISPGTIFLEIFILIGHYKEMNLKMEIEVFTRRPN